MQQYPDEPGLVLAADGVDLFCLFTRRFKGRLWNAAEEMISRVPTKPGEFQFAMVAARSGYLLPDFWDGPPDSIQYQLKLKRSPSWM